MQNLRSEQRAIATALSDVDALIAALDKLIAKKRHLKTATMQQLLTGKKRLPGFGEGKGYKQTEVGVIPEDWEMKDLGDVGEFKNGINKGSGDFGHGSPFVNLMDVFDISSISKTLHLGLVNSNEAEQRVYNLIRGDVLFVRSSVKPSGVGLTTVVVKDLSRTVYSGFLIRFRDNGNLDTGFKQYCFSEDRFRQRVIANSTVSANTNINQENLKKLPFVYPKLLEEQRAIATVLSDMDSEIAAIEARRAKTQAIKQGMMQQLLSGKVRLVASA
jgi:type I restriction enzyme S subunit